MDEMLLHSENVMFVSGIVGRVELRISWMQVRVSDPFESERQTHQIQDRNFHFALVEISRLVFHHLDGTDIVCAHILALDHLTKSPLPEYIQD